MPGTSSAVSIHRFHTDAVLGPATVIAVDASFEFAIQLGQ